MKQPKLSSNDSATNDTKIAVLENTNTHILDAIKRIDSTMIQIMARLDKLDSKITTSFFWLFGLIVTMTLSLSTYISYSTKLIK